MFADSQPHAAYSALTHVLQASGTIFPEPLLTLITNYNLLKTQSELNCFRS